MKREISALHLLFISFAAIFGSGWLFAPYYAAQIAGPFSLVAWMLGGIISAIIGMTMAEVVVLYPKTGGLNQLANITYGNFLSIMITVLNLLVFLILPAIETRAVLQYLSSHYTSLISPDGQISLFGYLTAFSLLSLITLVHLYGAKVTAILTQFIVFFKLVTPLLVCVTFFYVVSSSGSLDHTRIVSVSTSNGSFPWAQIFQAIATSGIIFSFNGFNQATLFAGETNNPKKAIPFAILGSLFFSGLLYLLLQYVFLIAVPAESIAKGWDKLTFSGDQGPFIGLAAVLGLGWILIVIYADAVISPMGTAFSYASAAPRLILSCGEMFFPELASREDQLRRFSKYSILLTLIFECLAFILLPNIKAMISLLVAAFVLCYTIAPASLLALRKLQPDLHRPFRVRMAPVVAYLSLFFSNLMVFSCGWIALRNLVLSSGVFLLIYLAFSLKQGLEATWNKVSQSKWFLFQLSAIAILCYWGQEAKISFFNSFVGIGLISLVALIMSQWRMGAEKQVRTFKLASV